MTVEIEHVLGTEDVRLLIETAEQAGIALVAFVRENRLTVYAHAERIAA